MKEKTFNIFLFVGKNSLIREMGVVIYEQEGNDEGKIKFLQSRVSEDYLTCQRVRVGDNIQAMINGRMTKGVVTYPFFKHLQATGMYTHVLEPIFAGMDDIICPLMVITPIVDGKPRIEGFIDLT